MLFVIVWNGLGYLVPVIVFVICLLTEFAIEAAFRDDQFYQKHAWPLSLALCVSGVLVWVTFALVVKNRERRLTDPDTGQEIVLSSDHSFFFVPVKWWSPILFALAGLTPFFHA
jgi:hypothetical protein